MSEKVGIDNLKKLLALGLEMGNVGDKIGHTEGAGAKMAHVMLLADEVMAMVTLDVSMIDDEYKDLSYAEIDELKSMVKTKLDLADDKIEMVLEGALTLAVDQLMIVKRAVSLVKEAKA